LLPRFGHCPLNRISEISKACSHNRKEVPMGQRRDKLNKRREKQLKTRTANAPRKARERARKAKAAAEKASLLTRLNQTSSPPVTMTCGLF
ncbi:MAG: hypothetical protein ACYTCN_11330, partial [Planctomycetota bacterium]